MVMVLCYMVIRNGFMLQTIRDQLLRKQRWSSKFQVRNKNCIVWKSMSEVSKLDVWNAKFEIWKNLTTATDAN